MGDPGARASSNLASVDIFFGISIDVNVFSGARVRDLTVSLVVRRGLLGIAIVLGAGFSANSLPLQGRGQMQMESSLCSIATPMWRIFSLRGAMEGLTLKLSYAVFAAYHRLIVMHHAL